MEASISIFTTILPIFLIIGCGAAARLLGWLDKDEDQSLTKLLINLLYPALIFSFILDNDALRKPENLIIPPLFGFGMVIVGFALSLILASKFEIGSKEDQRTFAFTTGIFNYLYLPLPIIRLLFDRETVGNRQGPARAVRTRFLQKW